MYFLLNNITGNIINVEKTNLYVAIIGAGAVDSFTNIADVEIAKTPKNKKGNV
ncbi:hypothetical protein B0I60_003775 [Clostridium beijerinckii]|nr:hypothetical protein [Clostridium beijerinckii]